MPTEPTYPDHVFFASPTPPAEPRWPVRFGTSAYRYASLMLALGFAAVFLTQAPLLYQIVFGAPVFEEFFKVGLALCLILPAGTSLRGLKFLPARLALGLALAGIMAATVGGFLHARGDEWVFAAIASGGVGFLLVVANGFGGLPRPVLFPVRLVAGLAVGAGFGVLEHFFSYGDEDLVSFHWRVAFHGLSTGLSMMLFHAVEPLADVRARWLAPAPSMFLHFVNNGLAVLLASWGVPQAAGTVVSVGVVCILAALFLITTVAPSLGRALLVPWAKRLPA